MGWNKQRGDRREGGGGGGGGICYLLSGKC